MSIFFPSGLIMVTKNNKMLLSIMDDGSLIGGGGGRQSFPAVKSSWAFIEEIPSYCKEIRKMPGNLKFDYNISKTCEFYLAASTFAS